MSPVPDQDKTQPKLLLIPRPMLTTTTLLCIKGLAYLLIYVLLTFVTVSRDQMDQNCVKSFQLTALVVLGYLPFWL